MYEITSIRDLRDQIQDLADSALEALRAIEEEDYSRASDRLAGPLPTSELIEACDRYYNLRQGYDS